MDSQAVFVARNQMQILITKLSVHIKNSLKNMQAQKNIRSLDIMVFLMSKAQNLVMAFVRITGA